MTQTPETPESLGLRLLEMANRPNCPQNEALALIAAGADVHVKDENGDTALHRAASRDHTAIVIALLEKGAKVGVKDNNGETALHRAAVCGHVVTVLALIERGADIGAKNSRGNTPLHLAACYGRAGAAITLIGNGANVNVKNNDGDTAERLMHGMKIPDLADRIRAAQFERATRGFSKGLENAMPVPPFPQIKKRRSPAP